MYLDSKRILPLFFLIFRWAFTLPELQQNDIAGREILLRPRGSHVFTIPRCYGLPTHSGLSFRALSDATLCYPPLYLRPLVLLLPGPETLLALSCVVWHGQRESTSRSPLLHSVASKNLHREEAAHSRSVLELAKSRVLRHQKSSGKHKQYFMVTKADTYRLSKILPCLVVLSSTLLRCRRLYGLVMS